MTQIKRIQIFQALKLNRISAISDRSCIVAELIELADPDLIFTENYPNC